MRSQGRVGDKEDLDSDAKDEENGSTTHIKGNYQGREVSWRKGS